MRKTIKEGFVGILWRHGIIIKELPPGRHWTWALLGQKIDIFDGRPTQQSLPFEEYATKDNLTVRCSVTATWSIASATTMVKSTADSSIVIKTCITDSLRSEISKLTLENLLPKVTNIHKSVEEATAKQLKKTGISLESLSPLNLLLPRSLKQAFEAEVAARKRAVAGLEEARGHSAVLRHLANTASLVEKQPALLQLLMGQKAKHVQFQFTAEEATKKQPKN